MDDAYHIHLPAFTIGLLLMLLLQEREGLLTNLSSVYVSAERFDDAIRLLKVDSSSSLPSFSFSTVFPLQDVSPDDETVHILLNRSSAFIGLKEFDVAEESLRRAIGADPSTTLTSLT